MFDVPRDELVQQLQQQLSTCIGTNLLSELNHQDFQHHLKAVGILMDVSMIAVLIAVGLLLFRPIFFENIHLGFAKFPTGCWGQSFTPRQNEVHRFIPLRKN